MVSQNIKSLRRKYHYTQEQLAQQLGIKRSLLGAYEEARAKPRLEILVKAATLFNVSVDQLVAEDMSRQEPVSQRHSPSEKPPLPVRSDTVIPLLEREAQAQYFSRREDQTYLAGLPTISLPMANSQHHTYRAFEITDDAMWPLTPGTIVVGQREENLQALEDGLTYIVCTRQEGMMARRIFNRIQENGSLLLLPANPAHVKITLSVLGKEVEVWKVICYISQQLPFAEKTASSAHTLDLAQLTALVLELQQEVIKLKEQKG